MRKKVIIAALVFLTIDALVAAWFLWPELVGGEADAAQPALDGWGFARQISALVVAVIIVVFALKVTGDEPAPGNEDGERPAD